jgi:hypothetical protein
VFLLSLSIWFQPINSSNPYIVTLYFLLGIVLYRVYTIEERLGWVKKLLVYSIWCKKTRFQLMYLFVFLFFKHLPFNSIKDRSCDLWHPSHSIIRLIQSVVSYISCKQNTICPICPLAKQYKLPFPISSSISNYVFNLLHRDVRGHMTTKSINGSRFFSHYCRWLHSIYLSPFDAT